MRKTTMLLDSAGTLYANYDFRIYNKKTGKQKRKIIMSGNDTTSNCKRQYKEMFRRSFLDALHKVQYVTGGTFDYDAKMIQHFFVYRESKANRQSGKKHDNAYYEKHVPDLARHSEQKRKDAFVTLIEARDTKTQKTKTQKTQNIRPNTTKQKKYSRAEQKERSKKRGY